MDNLDLPELDLNIDDLPSLDEILAYVGIEAEPVVLSSPPTVNQTLFTEKISIRIPYHVLSALKEQAEKSGMRYQTFINQLLAESAISGMTA